MTALLNQERRRRAQEAQEEHRKRILEVANEVFAKYPFDQIELKTIARKSGLKHGMASLYFQSLPLLFLTLLKRKLGLWYDSVEEDMTRSDAPLAPDDAVALIIDALVGTPHLLRFLALSPVVLDSLEADTGDVYFLRRWQSERLERLAAVLEERCPTLDSGRGFAFLRRAEMLAGAVAPLHRPPTGLTVAAADPDLRKLHPDTRTELTVLLEPMFNVE